MTDRLTCAEVREARAGLAAQIEALEAEGVALLSRCLHDETTRSPMEYQGVWGQVVVCAACRAYVGPWEAGL